MKSSFRALGILAVSIYTGVAFGSEAFSYHDLLALKRVQDPEVSPDGKWVAYVVREPKMDQNKFASHIWVVSTDGGAPRQITSHDKGESHPKWSPDGKSISFLSARGGSQQVWILPFEDGGEARQVTTRSTEADNQTWSPDGKSIAFTSEVWPDLKGDDAQKKRADEQEASGVKAQVIDHLLHRHWTEWRHGKRMHIFVTAITGGEPHDVTTGDFEAPPFSFSSHLFDFSPDSKTIAFTQGVTQRDVEAWSTDASVCLVSVSGGEIRNLTPENKGWDGSPYFSPDGKYIAYKSQARDGYEADKTRLALYDLATQRTMYLATDLDRSVEELVWAPDSKTIYFTAEEGGPMALYSIEPSADAKAKRIIRGGHFGEFSMPTNRKFIIAAMDSLLHPTDVVKLPLADPTAWKSLTTLNEELLSSRAKPTVESIQYMGEGAVIQSWLLKPPGFDASKKYPLMLLIHGGPQSAWNDAWSYRWNMMTWAAHGYVVLAPNFHGSSGFGQSFTESISGDWGGAPFKDLMKGVDWAIEQPYIDANRIGAAGASYGGYMIDWILGHTDRFKALVSHAGVYNLTSEYGVTEELWFPEWEFKGKPWTTQGNTDEYAKWSPHHYAGRFKTPTLVSHGEIDYRVPIDQGLQLFTALKRQGIPSRLLYYPDEGHWILKLKNSRLFYETVFDWVDRYLKP